MHSSTFPPISFLRIENLPVLEFPFVLKSLSHFPVNIPRGFQLAVELGEMQKLIKVPRIHHVN